MSRTSSPEHRTADDHSSARRRFLAAVGAVGTVGLAGCLGAADPESTETTTTQATTAGTTETTTGESPSGGDAIDAQFGFVGRSSDAAAPAEPDHEVNLLIAPREGAPVPEFYFDPAGLFVEAGAVVKFVLATPDHTVTAYHPQLGRTQRVPDGVPAISSPVLGAGTYWLYRFDTPGVYDLYCAPHEPYGMAMRVVVGEATGPGAEPVSMERPAHGEPRPPFQTSATVLADAALAPDAIVENERVMWADLDAESKQLQG